MIGRAIVTIAKPFQGRFNVGGELQSLSWRFQRHVAIRRAV